MLNKILLILSISNESANFILSIENEFFMKNKKEGKNIFVSTLL